MKWSHEICVSETGDLMIFSFAYGKLPLHPPKRHKLLYTVDTTDLYDEVLKKDLAFHLFAAENLNV